MSAIRYLANRHPNPEVSVKRKYWRLAREMKEWSFWPAVALAERRFERAGLLAQDPGSECVLFELIEWLSRAQDNSRSNDGGVARDFSLIHGWASSYPETTGYIIPTMLDYAERTGRSDLRDRTRRMLDWLVGIQLPGGGFQGGKIDSRPISPVTFNTGQILLGLAAGEGRFGGYRESMRRAADWLVESQDVDGCWRQHLSPFASSGEKSYETHVAWGLFEADRIDPDRGYAKAAVANVRWALKSQRENGWFDRCCLDNSSKPLTHTIGYALRGVLEAYRFSGDKEFLDASRRTADGLRSALRTDGHLPGCLKPDWSAAARWACLTGTAQIACCWLLLYECTQEQRYLSAALKANEFLRRSVRVSGVPEMRGGVKGSLPISGGYGRYQYLSWAAKFLADSLMLEMDARRRMLVSRQRPDGEGFDGPVDLASTLPRVRGRGNAELSD
jgi:hypothetical protein